MKKLLLGAFMLLTCSVPLSEGAAASADDPGYTENQLLWLRESWTGDEKPYTQARTLIDDAVQAGQKPEELAAKFKEDAKDWSDPLAQYRWAYPAYLAQKQKDFPSASKIMQEICFCLERADLSRRPRNYEYARLRFLAEARTNMGTRLGPVAQRLVQRDPQDYDVRFLWGGCMDNSPQSRQMSMDNIQVLLKAFPRDPRVHLMLAGHHYVDMGSRFENREAIDKTIATYQKVLSLAPDSSDAHRSAQIQIDHIKRMQKWYAERPNFVGNRMLPDGRIMLPDGKIIKRTE